MEEESSQQYFIQYCYDEFPLFHSTSSSSEPRLTTMTAIPDIESENGLYWYYQMICEVASKGNPKRSKKYFYRTDFIEVFEEYVKKLAAKLDG